MEMKIPKMEEEEVEDEEMMRRKKMKSPWMKASQLLEFQVQAMVYRYIEAGLRVPSHLLVPIWNSLARSSSSSLSSNYFIHHNHDSSSLLTGFNHINPVDPEPTRCRRTDGKKWRCSHRVLPFQKYCERHMHRGRKRSRKLVESSSSHDNITSSSTEHDNNGAISVSSSNNPHQVVTVASFASSGVTSGYVTCLDDKSRKMTNDDVIKQTKTSSCFEVVPMEGDEIENLPSVQKFFPEVSDNSTKKLSSNNTKNDIIIRSLFSSIHFSPDTVLQENEQGRCRRTDGKKWRCSKEAITGQKYCDKHMHRGIKKKEKTGLNPLTGKTSVTVMGIPVLPRVSDEKSNSSCSSDTTITDTALRGEEDDEEEDNNEEVLSLCCSSSGV